jgi:hypothetical protein
VNRNRNVNRNINVNRNVNVNHRYYGGGGYHHGHGHGHGHHHHGYYHGRPILAFATGMAIGSIIAASSMPSSWTMVSVGGVTYR